MLDARGCKTLWVPDNLDLGGQRSGRPAQSRRPRKTWRNLILARAS